MTEVAFFASRRGELDSCPSADFDVWVWDVPELRFPTVDLAPSFCGVVPEEQPTTRDSIKKLTAEMCLCTVRSFCHTTRKHAQWSQLWFAVTTAQRTNRFLEPTRQNLFRETPACPAACRSPAGILPSRKLAAGRRNLDPILGKRFARLPLMASSLLNLTRSYVERTATSTRCPDT